jgi:hypothetical protein
MQLDEPLRLPLASKILTLGHKPLGQQHNKSADRESGVARSDVVSRDTNDAIDT